MTRSRSHNHRSSGRSAEPQPLLTLTQVQAFFQTNPHQYGLFISLDEAAEISGNTPGTLRKHVSEGRYDHSVVRGTPLRFLRDQFCLDVANRPRPRKQALRSVKQRDPSAPGRKAGA